MCVIPSESLTIYRLIVPDCRIKRLFNQDFRRMDSRCLSITYCFFFHTCVMLFCDERLCTYCCNYHCRGYHCSIGPFCAARRTLESPCNNPNRDPCLVTNYRAKLIRVKLRLPVNSFTSHLEGAVIMELPIQNLAGTAINNSKEEG